MDAVNKAEGYLKKRFKVASMGRTLRKASEEHFPADWEVADLTGKIMALIQVKSSNFVGGARLSNTEFFRLLDAAMRFRTFAFLARCERGHYSTILVRLPRAGRGWWPTIGSWNEAVDHCKSVLERFRPSHRRIKIFIGFEFQPEEWSDCNHVDNPEEALEMAKREDENESRIRRIENRKKRHKTRNARQ